MICPYESKCTEDDKRNLVCKCPDGYAGDICRRESSFHIVKSLLKAKSILERPEPVMNGFHLPKYFRFSFDLWLEDQKLSMFRRQILDILPRKNSTCSWSKIFIEPGALTNINHSFGCLNKKESYLYKGETAILTKTWHSIEYTQMPILNSTLAEIIIKMNGKVLHKVVNELAEDYEDVEIYFGYKNGQLNDNDIVPRGKINNTIIEEYIPGILQ